MNLTRTGYERSVQAYLDRLLQKREIPGQYLVIDKQAIEFEYYGGHRHLGAQLPVTSETTFMASFSTKPLTAAAVLQLVEQGLVVLDRLLSAYYPHHPYGDQVTIRHLLNQTSGLPNPLQLLRPLTHLFGAIDGFLEEGTAMLGYTRAFYEMEIELRGQREQVTLHRHFYPPKPLLDEAGQPRPILVGYKVETQGIRFQVNPDRLAQTIEAILADEALRLRLRRNFAIYRLARYASLWGVFMQTQLETVGVAVDYWLQRVVPTSRGVPRLLRPEQDWAALGRFYGASRIVQPGEVERLGSGCTTSFLRS
jgi:hypothetical protein